MDATDTPSSERKRGRPRASFGTPSTGLMTPLTSMGATAPAPSPSPARRRGCNCKKSGCLKLYCECFAAKTRCGDRCQCMGCKNREHNKLEIAHAMETIEKRSQRAFKSPAAVAHKLETLRASTPRQPSSSSSGSSTFGHSHHPHSQDSISTTKATTPMLDGATRLLMSAERLEDTPQRAASGCICHRGACVASCPCHENFGGCGRRCACQHVPPTTQEKTRGCSCKKSNCLKLYCECLAAQRVCDSRCNCEGCKNRPDYAEERDRAISVILERNPMAFQPKVATGATQHLRGCNCRKSNCMKNYCECHQAGVPCTSRCACQGCRNTDAFVSAKKMLIFSGELKGRGGDMMSPDGQHSHSMTPSSAKPPRRPSRRASMDQSSPSSQFRTPTHQLPSALEMLSRTAPPAAQQQQHEPYSFIDGQNARMQILSKRKQSGGLNDQSGDTSSNDVKKRAVKPAASRLNFQDRLECVASPSNVQLPSVDVVLDAELDPSQPDLPLCKLTRSLLNAAQSIELTATPRKVERSPAIVRASTASSASIDDFNAPKQEDQDDGEGSPMTDDLLCEEDIETPTRGTSARAGNRNDGSEQRRSMDADEQRRASQVRLAALQERAVLQEFSVWLRNLTTSASPPRAPPPQ